MTDNENQEMDEVLEETEEVQPPQEELDNAESELDEIEGSDELEAEKERYLRLLADYENFLVYNYYY